MIVSYIQKGNEIKFLNTYSNFQSASNGFVKECNRIAKEQGVKPIDIAGTQAFITTMNFSCDYGSTKKTCKSIKEMEKWITKHLNDLNKLHIKSDCSEIDEMRLIILEATQPVFFAQAKTDSEFLKEMFEKKTRNWMIELL